MRLGQIPVIVTVGVLVLFEGLPSAEGFVAFLANPVPVILGVFLVLLESGLSDEPLGAFLTGPFPLITLDIALVLFESFLGGKPPDTLWTIPRQPGRVLVVVDLLKPVWHLRDLGVLSVLMLLEGFGRGKILLALSARPVLFRGGMCLEPPSSAKGFIRTCSTLKRLLWVLGHGDVYIIR